MHFRDARYLHTRSFVFCAIYSDGLLFEQWTGRRSSLFSPERGQVQSQAPRRRRHRVQTPPARQRQSNVAGLPVCHVSFRVCTSHVR